MFMANIIKILKKAGNDKILGLSYDNFLKRKIKKEKKEKMYIQLRLDSSQKFTNFHI